MAETLFRDRARANLDPVKVGHRREPTVARCGAISGYRRPSKRGFARITYSRRTCGSEAIRLSSVSVSKLARE